MYWFPLPIKLPIMIEHVCVESNVQPQIIKLTNHSNMRCLSEHKHSSRHPDIGENSLKQFLSQKVHPDYL